MASLKIRYVKPRPQADGTFRPRAVHGPRERDLGFADQDLKNDDGSWFTLQQASAWSTEHAKAIAAARISGRKPRAMPQTPRGQSVRDLLEDFKQSRRFRLPRADGGYSEKTKVSYRSAIDMMIFKPQSLSAAAKAGARRRGREIGAEQYADREFEPLMLVRAAAVTGAEITNDDEDGFFDYLKRVRGKTSARGCIMVLSAAYKWAKKAKQWRLNDNPCTKLGLGGANVSTTDWLPGQIAALVAYCDHPEVNQAGIADAVLVGLWAGGQREDDVLTITGAHPCEIELEMPDGSMQTADAIRLVQSKRGADIEVLALPPLIARLEAIAARRLVAGYRCEEIIVDNITRRAFRQKTFQHRLRRMCRRAAKGNAALGLAPCPGLADLPFKALRRTFLQWLDRSGASDNQWAAISGHSLKSLPQVKPHYSSPHAEQSREGFQKVWAWLQKKGIAS